MVGLGCYEDATGVESSLLGLSDQKKCGKRKLGSNEVAGAEGFRIAPCLEYFQGDWCVV